MRGRLRRRCPRRHSPAWRLLPAPTICVSDRNAGYPSGRPHPPAHAASGVPASTPGTVPGPHWPQPGICVDGRLWWGRHTRLQHVALRCNIGHRTKLQSRAPLSARLSMALTLVASWGAYFLCVVRRGAVRSESESLQPRRPRRLGGDGRHSGKGAGACLARPGFGRGSCVGCGPMPGPRDAGRIVKRQRVRRRLPCGPYGR
jgi:hypothetical protein